MQISEQQMRLMKKVAGMFPPPPILKMAAPGIEISDNEVRYVDLVDTGRGKEINCFGSVPLKEGIIKRGEVRKKEDLIEVIGDIAREKRFNFVRSSLPDERAYLFQTDVGALMKTEEIKTMLEFKLEEYVPVSFEDAVFDYMPIGLEPEEEGQIRISVSVFSRKIVEKYIEVFEEAGVMPFSFETDTQAISRAVIPEENSEGSYLIVNFGDVRTNLAVVYGGVVAFTSTFEIGGNTIDEAIQKHYSTSLEDAKRIKNSSGFIGDRDNKELFFSMMSTIAALKDEMNKHLSYWRSRIHDKGGGEVNKIVLCGKNAGIAGLAEYLQESMKIKTERGDVWRNAFSTEELTPPIHKGDSYAYATAVGLALRREGKE